MFKDILFYIIFLILLIHFSLSQNHTLQVYSLDPNLLHQSKELVTSQSPSVMPAYKTLIRDANRFLNKFPGSVMDKEKIPPSGDKHDYLSLSIYSWPNPKTPDGLPYITRDGRVNPESQKGTDSKELVQMLESSFTLALAYYLSGNEKYAEHCANVIRTWFLNPDTKMNPNLKYAQIVMGKNEGSSGGIIDSRNLIFVTEAAGLLEGSEYWTNDDRKELIEWFSDYLNWLLTSTNGKAEGQTKNNHLTFYKVQVINYELFKGDKSEADKQFESLQDLISSQIDPDGTQPLELKRTKSFSYSVFNLQAFFLLAEMGYNEGFDLYKFQSGGSSIKKALDFIAPYTDTAKKWPYEEIVPISQAKYWMDEMLRIASIRYSDESYENLLKNNFEESVKTKQWNLLYPVK